MNLSKTEKHTCLQQTIESKIQYDKISKKIKNYENSKKMLPEVSKTKTIDIEKLKKEIVERLKPLSPYKIILFGSYAYGNPTKDSDIDLYIVTNDEFMPKSWREKINIYLQYADKLEEIMKKYPIDLIVHTKKMHKEFVNSNSMFSRKVLQDGKVLS